MKSTAQARAATTKFIISSLDRRAATLAAAAGIGLVATLDAITGLLPDLTLLYLVPVSVAGLFGGPMVAVLASIASALARTLTDVVNGRAFETRVAVDTALHFGVFLLFAFSVSYLRRQLLAVVDLQWQRDEDLSKARRIQKEIMRLPPIPLAHHDVAVRVQPMREVGGDYVAVRQEPSGGLFVCVADVCGKGVSAALVATLLHAQLNQLMATHPPLEAVVRDLNETLCQALPNDMFVTALMLRTTDHTAEWVNCGHEPGLLKAEPGAEASALVSESTLPLGIEPSSHPQTSVLPFDVGACLLVVTDGVTESAAFADTPFSTMDSIVTAHMTSSAQDVVDAVVETAKGDDGHQRDDIAALCIVARS